MGWLKENKGHREDIFNIVVAIGKLSRHRLEMNPLCGHTLLLYGEGKWVRGFFSENDAFFAWGRLAEINPDIWMCEDEFFNLVYPSDEVTYLDKIKNNLILRAPEKFKDASEKSISRFLDYQRGLSGVDIGGIPIKIHTPRVVDAINTLAHLSTTLPGDHRDILIFVGGKWVEGYTVNNYYECKDKRLGPAVGADLWIDRKEFIKSVYKDHPSASALDIPFILSSSALFKKTSVNRFNHLWEEPRVAAHARAMAARAAQKSKASPLGDEPAIKSSGGNVDYYRSYVETPTSGDASYTAECNDIIESLGMTFAEGNAFKAIWRACSARSLGKKKPGYDDGVYDAEKTVFFANRMLIEATKRRAKGE